MTYSIYIAVPRSILKYVPDLIDVASFSSRLSISNVQTALQAARITGIYMGIYTRYV